MRAVVARVCSAAVTVDGRLVSAIEEPGLLVLLGVGRDDEPARAREMARKLAGLRILHGDRGAAEADAPVLVVSQFTLMGSTARGRRPSWAEAAPAAVAEPLVTAVVDALRGHGVRVRTGEFGAMMEVSSVNDGPFTVLVET